MKDPNMKRILAFLAISMSIGSCSHDIEIVREHSSGNGGMPISTTDSTASSASSGQGGNGTSSPCDPCENVDGTRLVRQRVTIVGDDGFSFRNDIETMYDMVERTTCSPTIAEDEVFRCMPYGSAIVGSFFGDPSCSIPVGFRTASACDSFVPRYAGESIPGTACGSTKYVLYEVASEFSGQTYYASNGACIATPSMGYKYYSVGPRIPPETWVSLEIRTEP